MNHEMQHIIRALDTLSLLPRPYLEKVWPEIYAEFVQEGHNTANAFVQSLNVLMIEDLTENQRDVLTFVQKKLLEELEKTSA